MEVTPPQLAGSLVGFLFTGNMGLSFIGPILTGVIADAYGLGISVAFIGIFPLLACLFTVGFITTPRR